jgi:hypothetical protein
MAFKVGSTSYFPGVFNFPTSGDTGNQGSWIFTDGTNSFFGYPGSTANVPNNSNLQYRSIFTHGYVAGGYKGSNPWRNINKTWHANDTTFSVGEQMDRAMAYGDGTFSDYNGYIHGTINAFSGASSHTSSYNLHNGVARQKGMQQWAAGSSGATVATYGSATVLTTIARPIKATQTVGASTASAEPNTTMQSPGDGVFGSTSQPFGYMGSDPIADGSGIIYGSGPAYYTSGTTTTVAQSAATDSNVIKDSGGGGVGGWDTSVIIDYHGCANDQLNQIGYIFGGGTTITHRLHFPSETMYTTTALPVTSSMTTCTYGATTAFVWTDYSGFPLYAFSFANQSFTTINNATLNSTPWNKAVSSKLGWHYKTNGDTLNKFSDSTYANISSFTKSYLSASEENGEMGQNWGYFLGNYNGQQNNQSMKINYLADACTSLGFASMPKGHFGMSSAACASAAATITVGYQI